MVMLETFRELLSISNILNASFPSIIVLLTPFPMITNGLVMVGKLLKRVMVPSNDELKVIVVNPDKE